VKPASLNELKKELKELSPQQLIDALLRVAKYKKENKELLSYLLFEADNEGRYIKGIKDEMDLQFGEINKNHIQYIKKGLRKILRMANKQIKFSGKKETEAELLIYFCENLRSSGIRYHKYTILQNMYDRQILKIKKAVGALHEDLQYDYAQRIEKLED